MSALTAVRARRRWVRLLSVGACFIPLLFVALITGYGVHLHRSARALIASAKEIRSTADAEREIAIWRQRLPRGYSESRSPDGSGRAYQFQTGNGLLSTLRLVPSTGVLLQVTTFSGELQEVLLGMYTEESSVWVQEDFSPAAPEHLNINAQRDGSGRPLKIVIMFTSKVPEAKRGKAFALNANCLVKPGGCKNAEDILPTWQQDSEQELPKESGPAPH